MVRLASIGPMTGRKTKTTSNYRYAGVSTPITHVKLRWSNEFVVQGGRWYATTLVMSNGSILVMGGGADPTVEIVPRIPGGDKRVTLDFLQRTSPNNLYLFEPISLTLSLTLMGRVSQRGTSS